MVSLLSDAAIAVGLINLVNTLVNIYWTVKLKAIQGNGEIVRQLTDQNRAKDEVIKNLQDSKAEYKRQFQTLHGKYNKLEGELQTYRKFHGHPAVDN